MENKIVCNINKFDYIRIFKDEEHIVLQIKENFGINTIMLSKEKVSELVKILEEIKKGE